MKRLLAGIGLYVLAAVLIGGMSVFGQTPATRLALTLETTYELQTNGRDTTYMRSLTHRYVNGDLRLLTLAGGQLHELSLSGVSAGATVTTTTNRWSLGQTSGDHTGIWWEEAKQRLWVVSSIDYGNGGTYYPTKISTLTLNSDGTVANTKTVSLQGVTSKRVYGGVQAVPAWAQTALGCGPYVVGWGGYTSLVASTSRGVIGPSLICIPDIATYANGAEIPASAFKVLLDTQTDQRGLRKTLPQNYFDGAPEWLTYPPTAPPDRRSNWLSPNPQGFGWWVWGDSYYNNAMWIDTPTTKAFVAVAALGMGKVWYQDSTLNFDTRVQEVHVWDPAKLGNGRLTRPDSMTELFLPRGPDPRSSTWGGNVPQANVSGATYDAKTGHVWLVIYPGGKDVSTGRLYKLKLSPGTTAALVDSDRDGFPDTTDACPAAAGDVPNGCPQPTSSAGRLPAGAVRCAGENDQCAFTGTREVAYGAGSTYTLKRLTGGTVCSNAVFGDPIEGIVKACYLLPLSTQPPVPATGR